MKNIETFHLYDVSAVMVWIRHMDICLMNNSTSIEYIYYIDHCKHVSAMYDSCKAIDYGESEGLERDKVQSPEVVAASAHAAINTLRTFL